MLFAAIYLHYIMNKHRRATGHPTHLRTLPPTTHSLTRAISLSVNTQDVQLAEGGKFHNTLNARGYIAHRDMHCGMVNITFILFREWQTRGSIFACAWIFPGQVIPMTLKNDTPVTILAGAWRYNVSAWCQYTVTGEIV